MFDPSNEAMSSDQLHELQTARLRSLVDRIVRSSDDGLRCSELGIRSGRDVDLQRLTDLPFTTKDDIVSRYPDSNLFVQKHAVVEWHGSSGTGGRETLIPFTRNDVETWSTLCARLLVSAGVTAQSIVANAYSLGLFTGGMGYHYGLGRVGASVLPLGIGPMARLVRLLQDMQVDTLACTPTYAARLVEYMVQEKIDPLESMSLRIGIFGAETFSDEMRDSLDSALGFRTFDLYGLSEVGGPGVAGECQERSGLHVNEDHFILEIVDSVTGEQCPDDVAGEIVLTTLSKEAGPVLRYRTGDLASISHRPCSCGRTFARISRIQGRLDDMVIVNGVNVYPRDVEEVVLASPQLSGEFIIVLSGLDQTTALVVCESVGIDRRAVHEFEAALSRRLGVGLRMAAVAPGSLDRGGVKRPRRVITEGGPDDAWLAELRASGSFSTR